MKYVSFSCSRLSTSPKFFVKLNLYYLPVIFYLFSLKTNNYIWYWTQYDAYWIICIYQTCFCLAQKKMPGKFTDYDFQRASVIFGRI